MSKICISKVLINKFAFLWTLKVVHLLCTYIFFFITKSEEEFRENKNAFLEINSSIWVQRI